MRTSLIHGKRPPHPPPRFEIRRGGTRESTLKKSVFPEKVLFPQKGPHLEVGEKGRERILQGWQTAYFSYIPVVQWNTDIYITLVSANLMQKSV